MWWSRGIGGRSALDYLIKVREIPFKTAVEIITQKVVQAPPFLMPSYEKESKKLIIPEINPTSERVHSYLLGRGISEEVISHFEEKKMILESRKTHNGKEYTNALFVGYNEYNEPKHISVRGITGDYKGDIEGSDKRYSFSQTDDFFTNLHVFEGAIDLLSYATLIEKKARDFRNYNMLSLSGVSAEHKLPFALDSFLERNPQIKRVFLHLDNDKAGRKASKSIMKLLESRLEVVDYPPPKGVDFNEYLKNLSQKRKIVRDKAR